MKQQLIALLLGNHKDTLMDIRMHLDCEWLCLWPTLRYHWTLMHLIRSACVMRVAAPCHTCCAEATLCVAMQVAHSRCLCCLVPS